MNKTAYNIDNGERLDFHSELLAMSDTKYRDFCAKLTPSVNKDTIIGVRMPILRSFAVELVKNKSYPLFLGVLPHKYFEQNNLHALILSKISDFDECVELVNNFLPYVDNWATCDSLRPKCFKKHKEKLLPFILDWLHSSHEYTVRFAIECLMLYYLDDGFESEFLSLVASVRREEYYIKMMVAWYFATALALRWDQTLPYITSKKLDPWVHSRTINKACESYRLDEEQKKELKKHR